MPRSEKVPSCSSTYDFIDSKRSTFDARQFARPKLRTQRYDFEITPFSTFRRILSKKRDLIK